MNLFQKVAAAATLSLILLIFVGATVRATGSGLGCPDWPTCWGCLVPPTSVDEVDFEKLDLEKFQRLNAEVTIESLRAEFNPVHVWVEYLNRLTSMPVGMLTLAVFVMSFKFRRSRPRVFWASGLALFLVLFNAWLGMKVVKSGLTPGVITLHMAAAILMLCVLVYVVFAGGEDHGRFVLLKPGSRRLVRGLLIALFVLTVAEGILGSQVREKTDALAHGHANQPRAEWIEELEGSWIYLVHRSFSWALVALAAVFFFKARRAVVGSAGAAPAIIFGVMLAQMVLGILLAFAGVPPAGAGPPRRPVIDPCGDAVLLPVGDPHPPRGCIHRVVVTTSRHKVHQGRGGLSHHYAFPATPCALLAPRARARRGLLPSSPIQCRNR